LFKLGHIRKPQQGKITRQAEKIIFVTPSEEQVSGLLFLTRKTISPRKSGMEFPKVGRAWGEGCRNKKKGYSREAVTP